MERLLYKPRFSGRISRGVSYIIVDDIVTQGGTISALRRHIVNRGGSVAAVAALAFSANSRIIAPDIQDVSTLTDKFPQTDIADALKEYNIAGDLGELTRPEVMYLLRFKEQKTILDKMARTIEGFHVSHICADPDLRDTQLDAGFSRAWLTFGGC